MKLILVPVSPAATATTKPGKIGKPATTATTATKPGKLGKPATRRQRWNGNRDCSSKWATAAHSAGWSGNRASAYLGAS